MTKYAFDLWSDTGTVSMSEHQWASMFEAHEGSYNPTSFDNMIQNVASLTGFPHEQIYPVHERRASEHTLFSIFAMPKLAIFSNYLHPGAHKIARMLGATVRNLPCKFIIDGCFNGDLDCEKLGTELTSNYPGNAVVILIVTSDGQNGQPVSMANIKRVSQICKKWDIPLFMDGSRFAENAYFIKLRDELYVNSSARDIATEMFSYCDGLYLAAHMCSIGGFFACRSGDLFRQFRYRFSVTGSTRRHGGMPSRDAVTVTMGLAEGIEDRYLKYRIESLSMFGDILKKAGVPIVEPVGSAIYINAARCLPHIPTEQYPAWALHCALYIEGGIRCSHLPEQLDVENNNQDNPQHFLRVCLPIRSYTLSHLLYIGEVFKSVLAGKERILGLCLTQNATNLESISFDRVGSGQAKRVTQKLQELR
ncbi:tryptophanase-like [Haliotis rubra]|uniref:tryptophanase-like n=1 Tax=Haliotis rubra TaxID=36100 RepID=UPI001EE5EDED|nr:tryptophanase-like [Haliotis rubra]